MNLSRDRRGIATVVVLFVLMVLTIGVFSYFSYMRARRLLQYRQLFGEFAHVLARAGMELARGDVVAALRDPDSELYAKLAGSQSEAPWGTAGEIELRKIDFLTEHRRLVEKVAGAFVGGISSVDRLEARVFALTEETDAAAPRPWAAGLLDTRQKYGKLFIEVTSVFQATALETGVEKHLLGYLEYRVFSPVLPVLNRFTLFLSEPTEPAGSVEALNSVDTDFHGKVSGSRGPLVLNNGVTITPDAGKTVDRDVLSAQGWVFLGEQPLTLNAGFSYDETDAAEQAGEDFLFYQESPDPAVKESQRAYADADANGRLGNPYWEIRYWDMGVNTLRPPELAQYRAAYEGLDVDRQLLSSLLRLNGRPRSAISPTLVLGKVSAGFLRLSSATPVGAPDASTFEGLFTILPHGQDPPDLAGMRAALPELGGSLDLSGARGQLYMPGKLLFVDTAAGMSLLPAGQPVVPAALYSQVRSQLTTRPYNKGLLFLKTNNLEADPAGAGTDVGLPPGYLEEPSDPSDDPRLSMPRELLPEPEKTALTDAELAVVAVMASLATSGTFPEDAMTARKSGDAADPLRFLRDHGYLRGNDLDLGTVLVWERPGPFPLPAIDRVLRGGMIVADEFDVEAPLGSPDDGTPLLLMARKGDIRIQERRRIFATLLAPAGSIVARNGLDVTGALLARSMDFETSFQTSRVSHLRYDRRLATGPWSAAGGDPGPDWSLLIDQSRDFIMVQ